MLNNDRPVMYGAPAEAMGNTAPWRPEVSVVIDDASGSMGATDFAPTRLEGAKTATSLFLRRKPLIDRSDLSAVIVFNDSPRQVSEFGQHPVEAEQRLKPVTAAGRTNITAALELALALVMKPQLKTEPTRRCILLSDGHHNVGPAPAEAGTLARLRLQQVIVDGVAVGDADEELLRRIAKDTGGAFCRCEDAGGLKTLYERLAHKKVPSV